MTLWKKDSKSANAHYINLFADQSRIRGLNEWTRALQSSNWKNRFLSSEFDPKKCNKKSDEFRSKGNMIFGMEMWMEAMELYNLSLLVAEPGTQNLSLAYANRASTFLRMQLYDECLRDIELAVEANYPHMPKLMKRKTDCEHFKELRKNRLPKPKESFEPKLSFNPDEKFPCMADVLEIQQNDEFGRHVVAKCDIGVGETILVEENFISFACALDRIQCYNCLQSVKNFIACSNCNDVMFCSERCRDHNGIHQKFCGATIHRMPNDVKLIATSILIALIAFSTVDEMMEFVEKVLPKRGLEIPRAANDPQSKYGMFLNLQPAKEKDLDITTVYKAHTGLLDIPLVKDMFSSQKSQRFLMHLIAEHYLIISNNAYGGLSMHESTSKTVASVLSLFNHACAPNVFNSTTGNTEVCITMRPIKKGDQLFVKYLCGDRTTRQRQDILLKQWGFLCKCDKCEPHCDPEDRRKLKSFFAYKSFSDDVTAARLNSDLTNLKFRCEMILTNFGQLPWSEEIDVVLKYYTKCLLEDFPSF